MRTLPFISPALVRVFIKKRATEVSKKRKGIPARAEVRNFVHLHGLTFNKAKVEDDRKAKSKRGYKKHKGGSDASFIFAGIFPVFAI
jgi:hypothetical protein